MKKRTGPTSKTRDPLRQDSKLARVHIKRAVLELSKASAALQGHPGEFALEDALMEFRNALLGFRDEVRP